MVVTLIVEGENRGKWLAVGGTVICPTKKDAEKFEREYYSFEEKQ